MASLLTLLAGKLDSLVTIARFRIRALRLAFTIRPIAGADDTDTDSDTTDQNDDDSADDDGDGDTKDDDDQDDGGKVDKPASGEPDWKRMARKHEREAKKARKEAESLRSRLQARADADKSEQEKAIEEAEQRARAELEKKFEIERQQDRLELATTKLASKGLKIGDGDDAKTVRFADPDDALLHLERDIRNGDLDREDIFDSNGRVRSEQLEEALADLISRKPHLAADSGSTTKKVSGTADARRGTAPKTDTTVDDHFKKIRRRRPAQAA